MNLFVDCGACRGIISRHWLEHNEEYHADLFEPRTDIVIPRMKNITVIRKAVWIEEREMKLYFDRNNRIDCSSLYKDKRGISEIYVIVKTIDFAKHIIEQSKKYEKIVVKMDIEGAEYEVVEHLIETGAIDHIDTMYVEWHWYNTKMGMKKDARKLRHRTLISNLKDKVNLLDEYYHVHGLGIPK
ncbi:MAG: FkbM family methyltransferase [Desulfobacterales bacterium]